MRLFKRMWRVLKKILRIILRIKPPLTAIELLRKEYPELMCRKLFPIKRYRVETTISDSVAENWDDVRNAIGKLLALCDSEIRVPPGTYTENIILDSVAPVVLIADDQPQTPKDQ